MWGPSPWIVAPCGLPLPFASICAPAVIETDHFRFCPRCLLPSLSFVALASSRRVYVEPEKWEWMLHAAKNRRQDAGATRAGLVNCPAYPAGGPSHALPAFQIDAARFAPPHLCAIHADGPHKPSRSRSTTPELFACVSMGRAALCPAPFCVPVWLPNPLLSASIRYGGG